MNIIIHPSRIPDLKKWASKYPRVDRIVDIGYEFKKPDEGEIRLQAYYIWERSGKTKPAEECWYEAKRNLFAAENAGDGGADKK